MTVIDWEYTDTFGGEANYAWCKRGQFVAYGGITDLQAVKGAKKAAGLSGVRCKREVLGETIKLVPYGSCTVLFIKFHSV